MAWCGGTEERWNPLTAGAEGGGSGCSEKSSRGGIIFGFGMPLAGGKTFLAAESTSTLSASSSRRSCFSYMIDERACSIRAVMISSLA